MAIKTVLLDLDGTILNTLEDLTNSVNFALASLKLPLRSMAEIRAILGNGVKNLITRALPENSDDATFEKCLAIFKEHYEQNKDNKTAPYTGIIPMLAKLHANGYTLAIVSNKHNDAVQGLYKSFFSEYVQFALGNVDSLQKKPNPDMVHYTLSKLGITPDEAVYVGDSEVDIETAKNSGIPCISVTWGFRDKDVLLDAGAKILVDTADELFNTITTL